jgi:hypothetical protein
MSGKEIPIASPLAYETQFGARRERSEGQVAHARWVRPERLSLAERIEQALLEAERLHGD